MSWKSFFHRVGEVAKNASMASPLGMIWDSADALIDPETGKGRYTSFVDSFKNRGVAGNAPGLSQIDAILSTSTAKDPDNPTEGNSFGLFDAAHFPYDYGINRPLSTLFQVQDAALRGRATPSDVLSGCLWRKAWNDSDRVSVGQAFTSLQGAASLDSAVGIKHGANDPRNPAFQVTSSQAQDYFKHDPLGKIQSGSADLIANLALDPLFFAGKGIKATRLANTTFKDATARDLSFGLSEGRITADQAAEQYGAKIAKRAVKQQTIMDKFLMSTRGMSPAEVAQLAPMRDTGDAGAIAYWIARADKEAADDADALARKRDIFGVIQGYQPSLDRLVARQSDLADEMQRMSTPVDLTTALSRFTWEDNGKAMLDFLDNTYMNPAAQAARLAQADRVGQELARLEGLHSVRASTSKFAANSLERAQSAARLRDIHESVMYDGMASRPVRVVRGTVGKAAPGFINTKFTDDGLDGMRRTLGNSSMDAATRAQLLDDFASAATRGDRRQVVMRAEEKVFEAEGARYGKTPAEVKKLLQLARKRRDGIYSSLRNQLYTAAPDAKYIRHVGEDGVEHAFDRPFLQSQLEEMVPLTDPTVLQKVLKQEARTGWLGAMTRGGSEATDAMDTLAQIGTRVWKDAQLFRLAYPMRVQVDTQMRLMASLGALQYAASAGRGFVNMLSNHNFIANDIERLTAEAPQARKSILTRPETFGTQRLDDGSVVPVEIQPARSAEELDKARRTLASTTYRDTVIADMHDAQLRQLRATGDFDIVKGGDPNWSPSMLRAVNHQIRNSPTAMKVLTEEDDRAVANWLRTDEAGAREWRNFSNEYDHDPIPWVGMIRAHVNHTLPNQQLRADVLERSITDNDLVKYFDDVTTRPAVHGEVYVPFLKSNLARRAEQLRNGWYKVASDYPETVMGRHPFYNARFRQHMRETIARMGKDELSADDVNAARRIADRKARKDMADTLFDLSSMSNLTHMSRFIAPFFAAWEDTMTKWGRLLYDDPSRAVRLEQAWTAPSKADMTLVDDQGQEFIILPGAFSPFGSKGWRIRKDSFNIVFQGEPWWLPGFGPLVQVPVNEMVRKFFPDKSDKKILKYVLPYGVDDAGIKHQLEPAWVRKAQAAFSHGSADYANTYAMLMDQELVKYNLGQRKTKPTKEEIAKATKNWHLMRALTSFGSPVSADPTPEFQLYIDKAHEYRDADQQTRAAFQAWAHSGPDGKPPAGQQPPPKDWQERFYRDFPQYFEMSTSLSTNNTGIVATDKAWQASQRYRKQIAEHPELGWFIVGPDNNGDFSQGVYANQRSTSVGAGSPMTFRGSKSPEQAVTDAEASKGWMVYRKGLTAINLELEARGLTSLQQKGAEDLAAAKRQFVSDLSNENPAWAQAYGTHDDNQAEEFLRSAKDVMRGDLAKRPDMVTLQQYLQGRQLVRAEMKRRGIAGLPSADTENSPNRDLRILWDQFTSQLVAENVGFEQMWQRYLDADTLRNDL